MTRGTRPSPRRAVTSDSPLRMPAAHAAVPLAEVIGRQRRACERIGSGLYVTLLDAMAADVDDDGPCAAVLRAHEGDAWARRWPLRFLGAVHWLVLGGRAPDLAAHYPSAGGTPGPSLVADFRGHGRRPRRPTRGPHRPAGADQRGRALGRAARRLLEVARRARLPLRLLEVGASAGLNLRWDHYWYDTGESSFGDPASPVRFDGRGTARRPGSTAEVEVAERRGCDRLADRRLHRGGPPPAAGRYVWPDQPDRHERLDAALSVRGPGAGHGRRGPTWARGPRPRWPSRRRAWRPWSPTRSCRSTWRRRRVTACAVALAPGGRARPRPRRRSPGCGWSRRGTVAELRLTLWPGGRGARPRHLRLPRPAGLATDAGTAG